MIDPTQYSHLVTLAPLDYFFFGGEATFGNGDGQHYYARSNPFPQQTSVLGLLRYLGYKNSLPIGESFDAAGDANQHFGYIHQLSPVFLVRELSDGSFDYFIPGPLINEKAELFEVAAAESELEYWNNGWQPAYQAKNYLAKKGWDQQLVNAKGHALAFREVFKPLAKIGITKGKHNEPRTDAFYKQDMYKLEKGWRFAVLAHLAQGNPLSQSAIAPFGAEKALFSIAAKPGDWSFDVLFPPAIWEKKVTLEVPHIALVSDAFVAADIYEQCCFAMTQLRDFRNIRTPQTVYTTNRFGPIAQTGGSISSTTLYKSRKYNLLARGSLLWSTDIAALATALDREPFTQIGYNRFAKIKKNN